MDQENVDGIWTEEKIFELIKAKGKYKDVSHYSSQYIYEQVINEIGLAGIITPLEAENLWNSLVTKYNECFESVFVSAESDEQTWIFFRAMYNAVNDISDPSSEVDTPVVLTSDMIKGLPPNQLRMSVESYYNTMEEEAARLEEAFRDGSITSVKEIDCDEEEDGEIISELLCAEDCVLDDDDASYDDYAVHDGKWSDRLIKDLILLRCTKEGDIVKLGQKPVFESIVKELGMENDLTATEVRKKWLNLVNVYLTIKNGDSGPDSTTSWPFYDLMDQVMGEIKKSSNIPTKMRKSPDFTWSTDISRKFIRLRTELHATIATKGHNAVYHEILEKLAILDRVSVGMARKKWNGLLKRYQDEIASGDSSWVLMREMKQVMKHFKGSNARKLKSRASPEFLWPNELTQKFIKLRTEMHESFVEGGTQLAYVEIMEKLGVGHILHPNQLRKKWNYLLSKYKEISASAGDGGQSPTNHNWTFYDDMQKACDEIPEHFMHNSKIVRTNLENIWTKEVVKKFIQIRGSKTIDANKKISLVFAEILEDLGISGQISPQQARKKWNYLYTKYLDLSQPDVDEFTRQSWAYYTSMQEAVSSLPISQVHPNRRIGAEGDDGDEDLQKRTHKRVKQYSCFLCNKTGNLLTDFFVFEQDQRLLHTRKTVVEIISQMLSKKVTNLEATTCLCYTCTNLANEADSIFHSSDRIRERAQDLYNSGATQFTINEEQTIEVAPTDDCSVVEEPEVEETELVVYSKRGRKRKANRMTSDAYESVKSEPPEDDYLDDEFEEDAKRKRTQKAKRKRGRSRGRKKGRVRSTLIGRGLGETYPSANKKKLVPLKGPKIYHCVECKSEFKKYTELITHKREMHTVVDTTTLEVHETILDNGVITYFNKGKANNSDTSHQCRHCSKRFLRKDDLWYHQEIVHTDGKGRAKTAFKNRSYDCVECGETFLFKYKLKMHINNKHLNDAGQSADDFACGECGCKLGSLPGLTFHMRKHHKKSLSYRKTAEYLCSDCGYMAPSAKKLKEHVDAHCGSSEKPQVQCEICGKTVLKVSLKMHKVKMHSDFKEQCERCGERYATKTDLLRHINVVHLGILLYTCQQCPERFPTSDSLRYHRVKVHEKPSFYCQVCGKCYKRVGELNSHIKRTHNERRKAETCQYCAKEYYDRSGLRNHLVSKHNVPQEMTYSENYLRKKRVDGLPLAKHMEKRITSNIEVNGSIEAQNLSQPHHQRMQAHPQHTTIITQHPHLDPSDTPRTLATYQNLSNAEENTLVVTEIAENGAQVEQAVLVNSLAAQPELMHHPQVAHIQAPMAMHHPMHHNMQNPSNMRVNLLYQMNMPHPGSSHINM